MARYLTPMSRRRFLAASVAAAGVAACSGSDPGSGDASGSTSTSAADLPVPTLDGDPFTLGVASGDPLATSVILWTRLAPDPVGSGTGGMPDQPVPVRWEVAADDGFGEIVTAGTAVAEPALGHSIHVDASGLEPDRWYWYRFQVGDLESPIGRTRTLPPEDSSPELLRLAVANCQAFHTGYYTAHANMAQEELDLVVFEGDYIYELGGDAGIRPHELEVPTDVGGFRRRYGRYKEDRDLQAAHAAFPWLITWDDHEVEDNYAGLVPARSNVIGGTEQDFQAHVEAFPAIRAAGYQAFYENLPLRIDPPVDGSLDLYRSTSWGRLATFWLLDGRQYRTDQPEGPGGLARPFGGGPQEPESFSEDATMLGAEQADWLVDGLRSSEATWKVVATPSVFAEINRDPASAEGAYNLDGWDGYVAERNRILGTVADDGIENVVALSGDIHSSALTDLKADFKDPDSPVVAAEFVAPSVSSVELISEAQVEGSRANEHVQLYEIEHRGYLRCEVTPDEWRTDYRWVDTATEPRSDVSTSSTWIVESGTPGAHPA